jgi:GT2 family glycosyltransferase
MLEKPLVSVIILNWNGEAHISECLKTLSEINYASLEVIVVDNASTDASLQIVKQFPHVHCIVNSTNIGYAAGNNVGFAEAHGKYIATLNNDVAVDKCWLDEAIEILENNSETGIISCRQMNYYNRELIDTLYSRPSFSLLPIPVASQKRYSDAYSKKGYVFCASGASAIYRTTLIKELSGFDSRFFAYHEESDLCTRAFYKGWKCVYSPKSIIYHKGSASFQKFSKTFCYYHERNRVWYIWKNFPIAIILLYLPFLLFNELRLLRVMSIKAHHLCTFLQARIDGIKGIKMFSAEKLENTILFQMKIKDYYSLLKNGIVYFD